MSVNTLLNTKWQINAALQPPQGGIGPLDLQFSSNSTEYTSLELEDSQGSLDIYYNSTHVFDTNTWSNQNYRTIYIYGGTDVTDSDMIDWLEEYAIQLDVSVKSVNADWLDANMRLASNAIRAKGGASSTISCPEGLSSAISNIPTGGGVNITGATDITVKAKESISIGDTLQIYQELQTLPDPSTTPVGGVPNSHCAYNPSGTRLAVTHKSAPRITVYDVGNPIYTKLTTPSATPGGEGYCCAWSPDGTRLGVVSSSLNRVNIYNTTTSPYSRITSPGTQPSSICRSCAYSPDGTRFAVGASGSPYIYIYDATVTPYTKLTNPSTLPASNVYFCEYSPDGTRLALSVQSSPYIHIYDTTTSPYTEISAPGTLPKGLGYGCAWSPDGKRLAVSHAQSPYITIYDTTTTPYTKLDNPGTLPGANGYSCAWSPDGTRLVVGLSASPYICIYDTTTSPYTKLTNPDILPRAAVYSCAYSPDGTRLTLLYNTYPYIITYIIGSTIAYKASNKAYPTSGGGYGYAKETITSGSTGTASMLFSP